MSRASRSGWHASASPIEMAGTKPGHDKRGRPDPTNQRALQRLTLGRLLPYKSNASLFGAFPAAMTERSGAGSGVPGSRKRLVIG
jgi:hypothetical protein